MPSFLCLLPAIFPLPFSHSHLCSASTASDSASGNRTGNVSLSGPRFSFFSFSRRLSFSVSPSQPSSSFFSFPFHHLLSHRLFPSSPSLIPTALSARSCSLVPYYCLPCTAPARLLSVHESSANRIFRFLFRHTHPIP